MPATRQQFAAFIQTLPNWGGVWKVEVLNNWATTPQESKELEDLYQDFIVGNSAATISFIQSETGNNLTNPLWVGWKSDVYSPEIAYLINAIQEETNLIAGYQAIGGADTALINASQAELARLQSLLVQYQADLTAENS